MRNQIIDQIHNEMKKDEKIFFLTADMGINLVEKIKNDYPDRYLNVGIAEQNLIGVASGLINVGYRVVTYTISNFLVHRCFEQLRNDISLHKKAILMVGTSVVMIMRLLAQRIMLSMIGDMLKTYQVLKFTVHLI